MKEHDSRFFSLDPLRGIAALWVLLLHYHFSTAFQASASFLHALCKYGELGVPMFFVISGFCLTASARSAMKKRESVGQMLFRRLKRIYPPFWCSILVVAAIPFAIEGLSWIKTGSFVYPSAENPNLGYLDYRAGDWLRVATLTQAFVTTAPTIGEKFGGINAVYWSLAIEVQFYLVVAAALASGKRFYAVLSAVTLASLPFAFLPAWYEHGLFLPWWPMFAFGIGLYVALEKGWGPSQLLGKHAPVLSWLVVVLAILGFVFSVAAGWQWSRATFAGCFAAVLWFAAGIDRQVEAFLKPKDARLAWLTGGLVLLGSMSYSIYLIHGRLQYLVMQVVRQVAEVNTIAYDLLVLAGVLALCYPFYRYCEVPFFRPRVAKQPAAEPVTEPVAQTTA